MKAMHKLPGPRRGRGVVEMLAGATLMVSAAVRGGRPTWNCGRRDARLAGPSGRRHPPT